MRTILINGSPKADKSASAVILEDLKSCLCDKSEIAEMGMHTPAVAGDCLEILNNSSAWIFACPLYVDGIPAHLLSCLVQLEKARFHNNGIHIYGIVNCGFYEGIQAEYALQILRNWCYKAGLVWGGGVGVGGGGALAMIPGTSAEHGPKAPVYKALKSLSETIFQQSTQENEYVSVAMPRVLYKTAAQMGWRRLLKSNGGKTKDLGKRCPPQ